MFDLAPEILALLFAAAVLAGFVDAIAGGGGLITVPALLAAGVPPVAAIATNKIQGSFGTAAATYTFWRKGRIDFALLKWPLIATAVGAALGAFTVTFVDTTWLMVLLPVLLAGIAVYFLVGPK
ncbi:TSUP family transporter, partial [Brevundimonas sp.]|uniref:TSUP family transporter n=1 Tax=Brevundimonas sp. TaxID=1871086 RepID=UPI0025BEDEF7